MGKFRIKKLEMPFSRDCTWGAFDANGCYVWGSSSSTVAGVFGCLRRAVDKAKSVGDALSVDLFKDVR